MERELTSMPQAVFLLVAHFMADMPNVPRVAHIRRWQLGNVAYEFLDFSVAAWNPTRPALYRIALQLLMLCGRFDQEQQMREAARVDRQLRRALAPLVSDTRDAVVTLVRGVARVQRTERAVLQYVMRRHPEVQASVEQARRIIGQAIAEDADSTSSEEQ